MLVRSASIYSAGEVLNRLCKIVSLYLLADIQSKLEFGLYNYILAAVGVVLIFLDCGLNTIVITRAHGDRLRRLFNVFFAAKCVLIVLVSVAALIFAVVPVPSAEFLVIESVVAVLTLSIGWDLSVFLANAHRANFDYAGEAVAKFLWNAIFVVALLVAKVAGVQMAASQAVILQFLGFAVAIAWSLSRIGWQGIAILKAERRTVRQIAVVIGIGAPFTAVAASASLLNSIELLLLGYFSKFEFLASFSVAHKFGLLTYVPLGIVQGFMLPYLAASVGNTRSAPLSDRVGAALIISFMSALSLSQLYILAIDWLILPAIGSEKYAEVAWMTRIIALYVPLMYSHTILWTVLVSMRFTILANLPAAIAVPVLAVIDYGLISMEHTELLVWSPVLANSLMLAGLAFVYRLKLREKFVSPRVALLGISCLGLILAMSYASPSDGLGFSFLRCLVALTAAAIAARRLVVLRRSIMHDIRQGGSTSSKGGSNMG